MFTPTTAQYRYTITINFNYMLLLLRHRLCCTCTILHAICVCAFAYTTEYQSNRTKIRTNHCHHCTCTSTHIFSIHHRWGNHKRSHFLTRVRFSMWEFVTLSAFLNALFDRHFVHETFSHSPTCAEYLQLKIGWKNMFPFLSWHRNSIENMF